MNYNILKTEVIRTEYTELRDANNYVGIANILNAKPLIDNPQPQQQTPKRLTLSQIFAAIAQAAPTDVAKLSLIPGWIVDRVESALAANDRATLANYLAIVSSQLAAGSKTALVALLAETEADPAWQAQVAGQSRGEELGLGWVAASDVQRVLQ